MATVSYATYLDKDQRAVLRDMLWDGNSFNQFMKDNLSTIKLAQDDQSKMDNLVETVAKKTFDRMWFGKNRDRATKLGYMKTVPGRGAEARPFSFELPYDFVELCFYVLRAIKKAEKKEEIKAAATGAITLEEAKQFYFPLVHFEHVSQKWGVKVYACQLDAAGNRIKTSDDRKFYTWNHYEKMEAKKYYQKSEIEAVVKKIFDNTKAFYEDKLSKLSIGMKTLESLSNKY